ncbi:hypothetical protein AVEN_70177-1 [Araneus ventricosus]|uniref:Uncharacterized protein n=1 Tax=Araneus ventricosus TaxID=182803 RepID=A0A4Y2FCQ8_ARAVE|nr:hypothetical protein AVEN_70177-1 [Araneus ventricosus]
MRPGRTKNLLIACILLSSVEKKRGLQRYEVSVGGRELRDSTSSILRKRGTGQDFPKTEATGLKGAYAWLQWRTGQVASLPDGKWAP